jgi:hypothetical protein
MKASMIPNLVLAARLLAASSAEAIAVAMEMEEAPNVVQRK